MEQTGANIDIKDVEFRLQHDSSKVRSLLSDISAASHEDLMLLKLILSCGLSPQMALADDCNNYKSTSEQLFHSRAKPFAALHPMGVFANHPEALQLHDHDTVDVPGSLFFLLLFIMSIYSYYVVFRCRFQVQAAG